MQQLHSRCFFVLRQTTTTTTTTATTTTTIVTTPWWRHAGANATAKPRWRLAFRHGNRRANKKTRIFTVKISVFCRAVGCCCVKTNILKINYRNLVYHRLCVYSPCGTLGLN